MTSHSNSSNIDIVNNNSKHDNENINNDNSNDNAANFLVCDVCRAQ